MKRRIIHKPTSFENWWRRMGSRLAKNPDVSPKGLAALAWRAGQQNKIIIPNDEGKACIKGLEDKLEPNKTDHH